MYILLISFVICVLLLAVSSIIIFKSQPAKQEGELLRLSETAFTALMGAMMIVLPFFILYAKYSKPALSGSDMDSYLYIGGFAVVCMVVGCGTMFYTFVKKIIACKDRILYINILGRKSELYWDDITEVKVPILSNKATFIGKNTQFTVGGEPKTYKEFIKIAQRKVKPEVGSDAFMKLLNRFMV